MIADIKNPRLLVGVFGLSIEFIGGLAGFFVENQYLKLSFS